jgi:hypothetical protein
MDHESRLNQMGVHLMAIELVTREILTHLLKTHEHGAVILDQCRVNTLRLLARLEAGRPEQCGKDIALDMHNAATEFLAIIAGDMKRE